MNELQSKTINWLRFALVIMVLFVHVHPDHNPNYLSIHDLDGHSVDWILYSIIVAILNAVSFIAVPLFFFISGYLFFTGFDHWSWSTYAGKMKRRIKTLLIPYILFNGICALSAIGLSLSQGDGFSLGWANPDRIPYISFLWDSMSFCQGWKNWLGFDMQLYYPQDIPLWFVRDLMVMTVLAPVIHWIIRKAGYMWIALCAIAYWSGFLACAPGFSSNGLLFFSLGAFFSVRGIDLTEFAKKSIKWALPISIMALGAAVVIETPGMAQPFQNIYYTFGIPVMFWIVSQLLSKGKVKVHRLLSQSSFFVYAIHMVSFGTFSILGFAGTLGKSVFNLNSPLGAALAYPTEIAFTVLLTVGIYQLMRKFVPSLLSILTGGR